MGDISEELSPGREEDARRVPEPRPFPACGGAASEGLTEHPEAD